MRNSTFWAGALLCAIGVAAAIAAPQYRLGTLPQMGPGYFPLVLGVLLALLGAVTCAQAITKGGGQRLITPPWRQLVCIPLSVVVFASLIERAGMVAAVIAAVLIACLGGHRFRPVEAIVSAVVLAVLTSILFVRLLGLPVPIVPAGL